MPELQTKQMIRVHIGYGYMLLDVTSENIALAQRLLAAQNYTTLYSSEHRTTHHPTGHTIADTIEIAEIKISPLSREAFEAAIAEPVEPALQAAE